MPTLTFTVDSALLAELGEKLVESAHVALVELVKNSYDADATKVTVRFTPQAGRGPDIEISDNGSGMTFEEVQQYWMRIATTHKLKKDVSQKYGRPRTGEKGIGRFSCRRLGEKLRLIAVAALDKNRFERTEVIFNWRDFVPGTEITTINCEGETKILSSGQPGSSPLSGGHRAYKISDSLVFHQRGSNKRTPSPLPVPTMYSSSGLSFEKILKGPQPSHAGSYLT
jgi:hypothetical protein